MFAAENGVIEFEGSKDWAASVFVDFVAVVIENVDYFADVEFVAVVGIVQL